ncbi:unnamed protein product [Adineta steineri]|uniref:PDZ domain-containing protein n=1 Tax=Adineta steineri TaxID=433720 RepID=A0A815N133_9BILA|nr:unnamed protein product [Adineta steineri]CAF3565640.1 unnamed protein product [Adineta steineri]
MKVIINFGETKVVVPCGSKGDISIHKLIDLATAKYSKLSYNNNSILNSNQVQLQLNNGAIVDSDDQVCDVVDDGEELFAIIESHQIIHPSYTTTTTTTTMNSNGELSSSMTSSNLSSSLSEHDRLMVPSSNNRHEVIVTDADLRNQSLRVKTDPNFNLQQPISHQSSSNNKITYRQTNSPPTHDAIKNQSCDNIQGMYNIYTDDKTGDKIFSIILPKENSPLGIHVVPYNGDEQQVNGLVLQNIEAEGRIKRQGILQINDRIIEINRINIERCSFDKAQLIFRTALLEPELELKIIRNIKKPPVPPKPLSFRSSNKQRSTLSEINQNNDLLLVDNDSNMNSLNTRRLGKIIKIALMKGNDGLGFKLASRDNPTGVANPIYVKTIFPKGAAIEDGRLQRGDRLLTVNSIDVTQMSLQETVGLLRETRVGDTVEFCISRQRDGLVPSDLINDGLQIHDKITNEIKPPIMTFDIPLNDTSSAGLGITLKGKTSMVDGQSVDLGIFVKSILTGGAASRDNRLRPNDQLLVINDSTLINLSNLEAAATLHEAVRREIHPGYIKVTISRSPITTEDEEQQHMNSKRYVKEIDLSSPSLIPVNNDENELDLTTFVVPPPPPPLNRKPPSQHTSRHSSRLESTRLTDSNTHSSSPRSSSTNRQTPIQQQNEQQTPDDVDSKSVNNPFERETIFRQSISEKRRLTNQPNKQVIQWKQRSFHEGRTHSDRKSYPMSNAASIEILTPVIDISDDDDDHDSNKTDNHCRYAVTRRSEQPMRVLPDPSSNTNRSSPGLIRSSSFESIQKLVDECESPNVILNPDEERKRQAKLRSRACNDSFRQAVDKSYCQNSNLNDNDLTSDDRSNKSDKQRFRFSNLFSAKSKRKEQSELKSNVIQYQLSPRDNHSPYYPPPPLPFSSRTNSTSSSSSSSARKSSKHSNNDNSPTLFSYPSQTHEQKQAYQPYRFDTSNQISSHGQQKTEHFTPTRHESYGTHDYQSKHVPGPSSLSVINQKSSHPPIPRQFLQTNVHGSQSLKNHQSPSYSSILPSSNRSPYPSTFAVQPSNFTSYSHNNDIPMNMSHQQLQQQQQQQTRRIGYSAAPIYPTSRSYFHFENPANV